ncbi:MAG: cytochrome c family protein [Gammaproteobacteria bacterium]|nr:cytochrome c family protein [Gammaproteobacteria bacterium]MBT8104924.1 cytochrome c family protein [Gammaproteobacteria bacterium]NNF48971.1 cytochrome c family protein [Woeseiaceae bacterium]NNK24938.1 cytochrome c family protein [Woeseiaceae bacterium]NNL63051.1 cytochrome c family protein [Woeseiaceae bacterium]
MNTGSRLMAVAALVALVAGCGRQDEEPGGGPDAAPPLTAETLGEQVVLSVTEYLATEPYASADRVNGERQAAFCRACHSLEKDGPHMIGPALYGFFGSKVGARQGFEYSAVMREADFIWTPEALDAWLHQPGRFMPGNRMVFAGVTDQRDRNDVIAHLLEVTSSGEH